MEVKFEQMNLNELGDYILTHRLDGFSAKEKDELTKGLEAQLAWIGRLHDIVNDVDPNWNSGGYGPAWRGTKNHRSMTFKCRQLAGFTYP